MLEATATVADASPFNNLDTCSNLAKEEHRHMHIKLSQTLSFTTAASCVDAAAKPAAAAAAGIHATIEPAAEPAAAAAAAAGVHTTIEPLRIRPQMLALYLLRTAAVTALAFARATRERLAQHDAALGSSIVLHIVLHTSHRS
eukprot:364060-Chlamydomonas_euryale.AAC.7